MSKVNPPLHLKSAADRLGLGVHGLAAVVLISPCALRKCFANLVPDNVRVTTEQKRILDRAVSLGNDVWFNKIAKDVAQLKILGLLPDDGRQDRVAKFWLMPKSDEVTEEFIKKELRLLVNARDEEPVSLLRGQQASTPNLDVEDIPNSGGEKNQLPVGGQVTSFNDLDLIVSVKLAVRGAPIVPEEVDTYLWLLYMGYPPTVASRKMGRGVSTFRTFATGTNTHPAHSDLLPLFEECLQKGEPFRDKKQLINRELPERLRWSVTAGGLELTKKQVEEGVRSGKKAPANQPTFKHVEECLRARGKNVYELKDILEVLQEDWRNPRTGKPYFKTYAGEAVQEVAQRYLKRLVARNGPAVRVPLERGGGFTRYKFKFVEGLAPAAGLTGKQGRATSRTPQMVTFHQPRGKIISVDVSTFEADWSTRPRVDEVSAALYKNGKSTFNHGDVRKIIVSLWVNPKTGVPYYAMDSRPPKLVTNAVVAEMLEGNLAEFCDRTKNEGKCRYKFRLVPKTPDPNLTAPIPTSSSNNGDADVTLENLVAKLREAEMLRDSCRAFGADAHTAAEMVVQEIRGKIKVQADG